MLSLESFLVPVLAEDWSSIKVRTGLHAIAGEWGHNVLRDSYCRGRIAGPLDALRRIYVAAACSSPMNAKVEAAKRRFQ